MENILEVRNLSKRFKDFSIKNLDLTLEKGFIMGLIGPNGAGKSTTIKLIMNLIRKDSGKITVFGLDNIKQELEVKERIGFVYDENHFYEDLTINETKRIIAPFYKRWDDIAFNRYIERFNLPLKKKIKNLSKGMKMKLSLALALSHNAELIIMDEPTSGLDPVFRSEVLDILRMLMDDENKGILFSTHITSDLDKIADYITFINNGEIVLAGAKDYITESYGIVKGGPELLDSDIRREFVGLKENHFGFEGLISNRLKAQQLFNDKVVIERPSIEDIMLYALYG